MSTEKNPFPTTQPKPFNDWLATGKDAATRQTVAEYVINTEQRDLMLKLQKLAQTDFAAYMVESAKIAKWAQIRIDSLWASVQSGRKAAKEQQEKAVANAESLKTEIFHLAETLTGKINEVLAPKVSQLPASIAVYYRVANDGKGRVSVTPVVSDNPRVFATESSGKRGRESKFAEIVVTDASGKEHVYGSLPAAANGTFLRPSDREMTYSSQTFATKACKGYGCKSVVFKETDGSTYDHLNIPKREKPAKARLAA